MALQHIQTTSFKFNIYTKYAEANRAVHIYISARYMVQSKLDGWTQISTALHKLILKQKSTVVKYTPQYSVRIQHPRMAFLNLGRLLPCIIQFTCSLHEMNCKLFSEENVISWKGHKLHSCSSWCIHHGNLGNKEST